MNIPSSQGRPVASASSSLSSTTGRSAIELLADACGPPSNPTGALPTEPRPAPLSPRPRPGPPGDHAPAKVTFGSLSRLDPDSYRRALRTHNRLCDPVQLRPRLAKVNLLAIDVNDSDEEDFEVDPNEGPNGACLLHHWDALLPNVPKPQALLPARYSFTHEFFRPDGRPQDQRRYNMMASCKPDHYYDVTGFNKPLDMGYYSRIARDKNYKITHPTLHEILYDDYTVDDETATWMEKNHFGQRPDVYLYYRKEPNSYGVVFSSTEVRLISPLHVDHTLRDSLLDLPPGRLLASNEFAFRDPHMLFSLSGERTILLYAWHAWLLRPAQGPGVTVEELGWLGSAPNFGWYKEVIQAQSGELPWPQGVDFSAERAFVYKSSGRVDFAIFTSNVAVDMESHCRVFEATYPDAHEAP